MIKYAILKFNRKDYKNYVVKVFDDIIEASDACVKMHDADPNNWYTVDKIRTPRYGKACSKINHGLPKKSIKFLSKTEEDRGTEDGSKGDKE